jgi:hypothetical protein
MRGKIFFLEIGHIGCQKIKNFMLISKKQTCLSDKQMPPRKSKNLKKLFSNFAKSHFFCFFNFNFFWGILSLSKICIFEISIKFSIFFIPHMTYSKEKNFTSQ